jgi:ribonuclease BN (tRNA processing enzyme)
MVLSFIEWARAGAVNRVVGRRTLTAFVHHLRGDNMRFKTKHFGSSVLVFTTAVLLMAATAGAQRPKPPAADKTIVVMLGTGTPGWDPDRSGPATVIVVNDTPYLVDFGPGVIRRAGAAYQKGVKALYPPNIRVAFLTHRHVDHTVGYADLIFSPAQAAYSILQPLEVYGPTGLKEMTEHILKAHMRKPNDERYKVNAHEIKPGIVYKDANVTVTAFPVKHGTVEAYGYRFETPDRTIVISGDTTPTQSVIDNCNGCEVDPRGLQHDDA